MGTALSASLAKGNYRLLLKGSKQEKLNDTVSSIIAAHPTADVETATCSTNASWEADIIILAVPHAAEKEIAERIREVANQKVVVSISNPVDEANHHNVAPGTISAAEELQNLLPYSKVVKAFNTTSAAQFYTSASNGYQPDAFIAGNDDEAINVVSQLVTTAGFNPVVAGDLTASRTLEQMQFLLENINTRYHLNRHAGWKIATSQQQTVH